MSELELSSAKIDQEGQVTHEKEEVWKTTEIIEDSELMEKPLFYLEKLEQAMNEEMEKVLKDAGGNEEQVMRVKKLQMLMSNKSVKEKFDYAVKAATLAFSAYLMRDKTKNEVHGAMLINEVLKAQENGTAPEPLLVLFVQLLLHVATDFLTMDLGQFRLFFLNHRIWVEYLYEEMGEDKNADGVTVTKGVQRISVNVNRLLGEWFTGIVPEKSGAYKRDMEIIQTQPFLYIFAGHKWAILNETKEGEEKTFSNIILAAEEQDTIEFMVENYLKPITDVMMQNKQVLRKDVEKVYMYADQLVSSDFFVN